MPHILIADDNAVSLEFFAAVLRENGHQCLTAVDGMQALQLARHESFDLLLFDINMPQLSGLAVLRRLRADPAAHSRSSVAIATSAEMDKLTKAELLGCGFSAILPKPIDITTLNRLIDSVLVQAFPALQLASLPDDMANSNGRRDDGSNVLLDDTQALSACGDISVVQALRKLFAKELDVLPDELQQYADRSDVSGLRERMHRLRASCGFCGAVALTQACLAWRGNAPRSELISEAALAHLLTIAVATRAQL